MAGHSKWAQIKRKKAVLDRQRGKVISKHIRAIQSAVRSGGSHGFVVGHVSPEAAVGGPIALVRTGDEITIDAVKRRMTLHVPEREMKRRRAAWRPPRPYATRGVLAKYAASVSSASQGAITDGRLALG